LALKSYQIALNFKGTKFLKSLVPTTNKGVANSQGIHIRNKKYFY